MKIVVCVRYGLNVDELKVNPDTGELKLDIAPRKIGEYDLNALAEAARLKEEQDAAVQLLSLGPVETRDGFREALAMGADGAVVVVNPDDVELDTSAAVEVMAAAIEKLGGFDLILCGEASIDHATYQFAPMLAERLNLPNVAYANRLAIDDSTAIVDRNLGDHAETLRVSLPAVVSVTGEINEPKKPTLMQVLKAKDKEVVLWDLAEDLGLSTEKLAETVRLRITEIKGYQERRKKILIKGKSPVDAASDLLDRLGEEGILNGE